VAAVDTLHSPPDTAGQQRKALDLSVMVVNNNNNKEADGLVAASNQHKLPSELEFKRARGGAVC